MRLNKKYRITIEDQSSLDKKIDFTARFPALVLLGIAIVVLAGAFGIFMLASTPMKNYLPGYLKESERTATEEQHLRIDSLARVYEMNQAYIRAILDALNPNEESADSSLSADRKPVPLTLDSLIPISAEEKKFMETYKERGKKEPAQSK